MTYNQARGWATNLSNKSGGIKFSSYALTYDAGLNTVGNLTGVTEPAGTVAYTYDALCRMTKEVRTGAGANTHTHTYDLAGNRTKLDTLASTYDDANKLLTIAGGTVSHDADGNILSVAGTGVPGATYVGRPKQASFADFQQRHDDLWLFRFR